MTRVATAVVLAAALSAGGLVSPADAPAQYFGRNKVQYDVFDWRVARSERFEVHFYPEAAGPALDASRMADRWHTRLSGVLDRELTRVPLILYADHPDFQQTNVIGGFIGEATGGATEGLRNRIILPFTGSYGDFHHVLGHEIVHAFQFDMARAPGGPGLTDMGRLSLFVVEGMAEYLSLGRVDPHTAMWLRDAVLREELPTIRDLTRDPRFFPYRYGHALWAYIGGVYGDTIIAPLFRGAMRQGWDAALSRVLGVSEGELSRSWIEATRATYLPLLADRTAPGDLGRPALADEDPIHMNVSPVLSPDGDRFVFFSSRELFTIDLFVADARTGRVIRRLTGPRESPHFDALSFINSAGTWSPDGERLAFVVFAEGRNELAVLEVATGRIERQYAVRGVGAIMNPAWSPDGRRIAFSGMIGGESDLYVLDLATQEVQRLTADRYAALQPAWSPDGGTLVFVTDRGPGTDLDALVFAPLRLAFLDLATGAVESLTVFEGVRHINPQYSPDGESVFFVADREGFSDVYRLVPGTGEVHQVTRVATGVSGITALSPALTVAAGTGEMMVSVFEAARYRLVSLPPEAGAGTPVAQDDAGVSRGGALPPVDVVGPVERYLVDPFTGLPPVDRVLEITDYSPRLSLLMLGPPTIGVTADPFGTTIGGGAAALFTDMLGNRTLGVALYGGGGLRDLGGQVSYRNLERRWNWGGAAGRTPYLTGRTTIRDTTIVVDGVTLPALLIGQTIERVFLDQVTGVLQYPFTTTRRFELNGGYTRFGFDRELDEILVVGGQVVGERRSRLAAPAAMHFVQTSGALVGDNSFHGFTSPVAGHRYRLEATPTLGTVRYYTLLGDWRNYQFFAPFTLAVRGLTFGRYGGGGEDPRLSPLYVGYGTLVRGYGPETFSLAECTAVSDAANPGCPEFDRLVGSRIGVANLEFRIPLLGTDAFGLLHFPWLPTEVAPFVDGGVAWTRAESPVFRLARESTERIPVFSAGLTGRFNVLGYFVAELYYARPFQRPARGHIWGLQIAPGW